MELGIEGRRAIVTGGSKGLGLAIARELVREGASVAICARNEEEVVAAGEELRERGATVHAQPADVTDPEQVRTALGNEPVVAYLALPPAVFAPAIEALKGAGLAEGSRIVVEKPFGEDLEAAKELNRLLHEAFPEEVVFRADHFLGLQTVQNVLGLRFANRVFEPV